MKRPRVINHVGKGGAVEALPSRSALSRLVGGDPAQRTMNQYAKATPTDVSGLRWPKPVKDFV